jgi:hypothetical protein
MGSWRLGFVSLSATLAIAFSPTASKACQCGAALDPATGLSAATAVFAGRVYAFENGMAKYVAFLPGRDIPVRNVMFEVSKTWKGDIGSRVAITVDLGNCDYEFQIDNSYIVYASDATETESLGDLRAIVCLPTKPLDVAQTDFEVLGPGSAVNNANEHSGISQDQH